MKKILIVDDSNTNVVLLQAILNSRGYDIQTAYNVDEAQKMREKDRPELILLDLLIILSLIQISCDFHIRP